MKKPATTIPMAAWLSIVMGKVYTLVNIDECKIRQLSYVQALGHQDSVLPYSYSLWIHSTPYVILENGLIALCHKDFPLKTHKYPLLLIWHIYFKYYQYEKDLLYSLFKHFFFVHVFICGERDFTVRENFFRISHLSTGSQERGPFSTTFQGALSRELDQKWK